MRNALHDHYERKGKTMTEAPPTTGRELMAAGRMNSERGHVDISDRELIALEGEQRRGAERMLGQIIALNPQLLFTTTRDLMQCTTRIEWEPKHHHLLREVATTPDDIVGNIRRLEAQLKIARETNALVEESHRAAERRVWQTAREWDAAKKRVTMLRAELTAMTTLRHEQLHPTLDELMEPPL